MNTDDENNINEPAAEYKAVNPKQITFFKSFEEENEYTYKMRAGLSYEERLTNTEILRKRMFHSYLLPNGNWPLLSRKITVIKLPYEVC